MAVLADLRGEGNVWRAVAYFTLWSVRLTGVLPELRVSDETAEIVGEMFGKPIADLAPREWTKSTAQDLRRGLVRTMEQHVERRFLTVPVLEAL
jgi:DNA repair protein RecO (recombination protein O)